MTPEEFKNWLRGVFDAQEASGHSLTLQELLWIRRALDVTIAQNELNDPMAILKHTHTVVSC